MLSALNYRQSGEGFAPVGLGKIADISKSGPVALHNAQIHTSTIHRQIYYVWSYGIIGVKAVV